MATKDVEVELQEVRIDIPPVDPGPSGRTPEAVLVDLKKAIQHDDVKLFNQHLAELERLLQDGNTVAERLVTSGALCSAVIFGSVSMRDTLIEKGVDINTKSRVYIDGWSEWTPLHVAAFRGSVDTLRYFIDKGADVNVKDDCGRTPLRLAARKGNIDKVRCLVEKGADVNIKDDDGRTPLHVTAESGNVDTLRYLGDKGADINIKDEDGRTPLHVAAESGTVDKVRYLGDKGADINIKDGAGNTPLHLVAKEGYHDAVRYLVDKGADVNIRNHCGTTPLHMATKQHHRDTEKYLVDHGADVNMKDGENLLEDLKEAIRGSDVESFQKCLSEVGEFFQDDDSTARGLAACGALCYAARAGSIPIVDTLIRKGVDVNTKSNIEIDGYEQMWTPLHEAAGSSKAATLMYLVDKGAGVNIKDDCGRTPLHVAAARGNANTVRYLIEKGADVNIKEDLGRTPLFSAVSSGEVDVVRHLVEKVADINVTDDYGRTALHVAAESGNADTVRYLIEKGADVKIKDAFQGRTPLFSAASSGNVDAVRHLVEKVADVNVKDDYGRTPLHWAAKDGDVETVRYLVEKGAVVNIKEQLGQTPLHRACGDGNAETVKYLLEKGADPSAKDDDGDNSLYWAFDSRHKDVVAILLGHDKWKEMMRTSWRGTTLMRNLIAFMPDVAEVAFNKCVTTNEGKEDDRGSKVHATSDTFEVEFNYEFLEDFTRKCSSDSAETWRPTKFTKYNHPLHLIRKHDCSNLLKHLLVISLLEYKWTRFGRYIFFGNLFIYLIFLTFLTAFGLVVLSPLERTCVDVFSGSFKSNGTDDCKGLSIHEYRFLYLGAIITILTAVLRLVIELFQLCKHPLEYLLDWVNWLEIPLYVFSIIFTFVFATPCLCVHSWQWQIGVVAVFLGWIGLIAFLQKWPVTAVYVLMFVNILWSFFKVTFLALLLVIAFALAFYMLLFEPDEMRTPFSHPGRAIVKVMAMTTGELDYDELYHQREDKDEIAFPPVSFLLWIVFLVLMPVLLSNLLVGLAVGDVDRLQKTASENRIELQIDLVLSFEELLESLGIRHRFTIKQSKTHYPNVPATLLPECCKIGTNDFNLVYLPENKVRKRMAKCYSKLWIIDEYSTSGVKVSDAIKPPLDSLENQLQQLEAKLKKQAGRQREQLEVKLNMQSKQLKEQCEQLETKLKEDGGRQSEQFQEAVRQLSECHKEQGKKMEVQTEQSQQQNQQLEASLTEQLEVKLQEQSEQLEKQSKQLEARLKEHSEKLSEQFQEAVRQLTECHKELAKKTEEQTEQLACEVVSLREVLEKLTTQMAAK